MDDKQQNFYKRLLINIRVKCLKQGIKKSEFCLKQGRKISDICLKQGQGMRDRAAPPHQEIYRVPPPPPRDTFIADVSSSIFIVLGIVAGSLILSVFFEDSSSTVSKEDSSSTLWIRPLFLCCGFIHCLRADSSTRITGDSSPLF